ncbi:MAG: hypothetical protein JW976_09140 [Syntrophaceae bacterium]|nr:hypothetical protein [Syntrophaceae bacterium]
MKTNEVMFEALAELSQERSDAGPKRKASLQRSEKMPGMQSRCRCGT